MELFSELYSSYYLAMKRMLEAAQEKGGLTQQEICEIIGDTAFSDSAFFILPQLNSEWQFFDLRDGKYLSRLTTRQFTYPITRLQQAWLMALFNDERMGLFLKEEELTAIKEKLGDVPPLFHREDFRVFDRAGDGDPYGDPRYIENFRGIIRAIKAREMLKIKYDSGKGNLSHRDYLPQKLNYSGKDDKFRLIALELWGGKYQSVTLNLARIIEISPSSHRYDPTLPHRKKRPHPPLVLRILRERNALERCMLQFASMKKETEYDEATDSYLCKIYYDPKDETELLIRILGFGPVVKVLGPEGFLEQMRERIKAQVRLSQGHK